MSSKNSDTQNRILKSAWELLESDDGNTVRMSDIARKAGISRQAVYLHYPKRADLLIATTRYLDTIKDIDGKLAPSRDAKSGIDRLNKFIDAWGNHIPEIFGVAKALMAMKDTDVEAETAWNDRMQAVRHGCEAAVKALAKDGTLAPDLTAKDAVDTLWNLLSVRNWDHLRNECGWSQKKYLKMTRRSATKLLLAPDYQ